MPSPWPVPTVALTPVSVGTVLWRMAGVLRVTVVVKATFGFVHDGIARLIAPREILREDRGHEGGVVEAAETAPFLPSTGVLLTGHAHAPAGRPAPSVAVRLGVFRDRPLLDKTVHVFGYRPRVGVSPQPFQKIALGWDRAFGGAGFDDNPVGTGVGGGAGMLPNLVDPADPQRPAGFGPVARHWGPRRRLLGGLDPLSLAQPVIELPAGVDFRFFHAAPADQQIDYLHGDEWIVLDGMHPAATRENTRLPGARAEARWVGPAAEDGSARTQPVELVLDTLVIDGDRQVCSVIWRGCVAPDEAGGRVEAGLSLPGHALVWPEVPVAPVAPVVAAVAPLPKVEAPVEVAMDAPTPTPPAPPARPARPAPESRYDDDEREPTQRIVLAHLAQPALPFRKATLPPDNTLRPLPTESALPFRPAGAAPAAAPAPEAGAAPRAPAASPAGAPGQPRRRVFTPLETDVMDRTGAVDMRRLQVRPLAPFAVAEPGSKAGAPAAPLPGAPWSPGASPVRSALPAGITTLFSDDETPATAPLPGAPWGTPVTPVPPVDPEATTQEIRTKDRAPKIAPPARVAAPPPEPGPALFQLGARLPAAPALPSDVGSLPDAVPPPGMIAPPAMVAPPGMVAAPLAILSSSSPGTALDMVAPPVVMPVPVASAAAPPAPAPQAPAPPAPAPPAAAPAPVPRAAPDDPGSLLREKVIAALAAREALRGLDLRNAMLRGVDFSGASLASCKMGGADLSRCNFTDARMADVDLIGADLTEAELTGADLTRADLTRATLTGATLVGALLTDANLSSARGPGASFAGARGLRPNFARGAWEGVGFERIEVTGADFTGAQLGGARFDGATLLEVRLDEVQAERASFEGARLPGGHAEMAAFRGASFKGAEAPRSVWERATLDEASFAGADLTGANLGRATCARASFVGARMAGANLVRLVGDGADLGKALLQGADLRGARLPDASFEGADLRGIQGQKVDLSRARLTGADLTGANLRAGKLTGAVLAGAVLASADLRDADLERADVTGASRGTAKMNGANLKDLIGAGTD